MSYERELSVAREAAREAGAILRRHYEHGTEAWEKSADNPVTLADLEADFERESRQLRDEPDPSALEVEEYPVQPRKSDTDVERVVLVWTPWGADKSGIAERLF